MYGGIDGTLVRIVETLPFTLTRKTTVFIDTNGWFRLETFIFIFISFNRCEM